MQPAEPARKLHNALLPIPRLDMAAALLRRGGQQGADSWVYISKDGGGHGSRRRASWTRYLHLRLAVVPTTRSSEAADGAVPGSYGHRISGIIRILACTQVKSGSAESLPGHAGVHSQGHREEVLCRWRRCLRHAPLIEAPGSVKHVQHIYHNYTTADKSASLSQRSIITGACQIPEG